MTDEQKKAIYQYIAAQLDIAVVDSPFVGVLPQEAILNYFIDHQKEFDVTQILSDQQQKKKDDLQKQIDDATAELNTLEKVVTPLTPSTLS